MTAVAHSCGTNSRGHQCAAESLPSSPSPSRRRRARVRHLQLHAEPAGEDGRPRRHSRWSWRPPTWSSAPSSRPTTSGRRLPGRAGAGGAFAKPDEVIGRGLIVPIVKNEPILRQAGVEGSRRRPAAGDSRGHARRVGARQRGHRRRRLRAARHARRRRRHREPDRQHAAT